MRRRETGFLAGFLLLSLVQSPASPSGEIFVQATARVSGRVSVAGDYRAPAALPVFKNRDFCGLQVANETLLIGRDRGLKNAVVILRPLARGVAAEPKRIVLDNLRCAFVPHVQVAPVGSELLLKNSDAILHTVHARLDGETLFNVGLPRWRTVTKRLGRAGVVKVDCDVLHTWMSAIIVITDSPFYAQSDETGLFSVERIRPGSYELQVFHERLGYRTQRLELNEGRSVNLDIVYSVETTQ